MREKSGVSVRSAVNARHPHLAGPGFDLPPRLYCACIIRQAPRYIPVIMGWSRARARIARKNAHLARF